MKHLSLALLILAIAACSAGEKARTVDFVPAAVSSVDFGDMRVHYNALPTLSLNQAVAREYGVSKDAGTGLLVVALRRVAGSEELAAEGQVSASAYDLQGTRQNIVFHPAKTGEYTDHIGTFAISSHESYRFEVTLKSGSRSETFKFQRNF